MRKKIELLVLLLALAGIYTVSRNLEKYVQSDQVKSEQERKMDLVVIDSGHGGSDPGKVGINEVLEKDINLKISKQVEKELKNKGYQVVMTREKDQMLAGETSGNSKIQDMKARVDLINEKAPGLRSAFIRIVITKRKYMVHRYFIIPIQQKGIQRQS